MGSFLGFAGRLLSRSCRSNGREVPPLRLRRRGLRVSGPTVRPVNRSQNLYTSGQSDGSLSQDVRNKCIPISRRLASGRRDAPAGSQSPGHGPLGDSEGRVHFERREVRLGSVPVSSVSGVFARLGPPPGVSVGGSDRSFTTAHPSCSEVAGETLEVVVRPSGQHDSAGAESPTTHSSPQVQERWDMSMPESTPVFLTPAARETLQWWLHTPNLTSGVPFSDPVPEMTIITDASSYGWGGHLGDQTASGTWQPQEKLRHINWLELQAVWLTLQHFLPQLGGTVVEVLSDNMTTVSYINKQGGTHSLSLCRLALDLWEWCDEHRIIISAVHLAGESNVLADALSRGNYCLTEWTLHRPTSESLWQVWERPFVDMFASKNAQFPVYYCLGSDPQASGSNALTMDWDMVHGYAFPPIALIPRVLRKILRHPSATIVLARFGSGN